MSTPPSDPPEGSGEAAEKHFWDEHEKRTKGILDKWFDEKVKTVQSQRGTGRNTLPKILADLFFPEPSSK
jgi:hypothetical protein